MQTSWSLRAVSLLFAAACSSRGADTASVRTAADAGAAPPVASAPTPTRVTGNLRQLAWIEGAWRGSGETQAPFYERYRLADDSTLVVETFPDSTMATVNETSRFLLRNGSLTSVPGTTGEPAANVPRWYASALSADSVRFEPLAVVRNTFVWRRGLSAAEWLAVLSWPATAAKPARMVTYTMRRWP